MRGLKINLTILCYQVRPVASFSREPYREKYKPKGRYCQKKVFMVCSQRKFEL